MTAGLVKQGAKASAAMLLTEFYQNNSVCPYNAGHIIEGDLGRDSNIFTYLWGPQDPWAMIRMGFKALEMGPTIDVFIHWNFSDASPGRR